MSTNKRIFDPKQQHPFANSQNADEHQYSNLNLNEKLKCLDVSNVQTCSKTLKSYKSLDSSDNDYNGRKEALQKWNKLPFYYKINGEDIQEMSERQKANRSNSCATSSNNSTLSLHIAAYENTIETSNEHFEKGYLKKENEKLSVLKTWKNTKQIFPGSSSIIQNSFEFPRQQENQSLEPETMQFKASQQLLNPNLSENMDNSITETKKEMEQLRDELKEMKKIVEELQNDRPSEESFNQFRNELNSFKQPLQQICNGMNIAFEGFKGIQKHLCGANDIPKSTIQATAANGERKMSDSVAEESWKKLANIAKDLNSDDQLRALQQACRITNQFRNVKHFSENRFVSIFVESLNSENDEVKFVAAKALSNIAQGTPEQIKSFIDSDAIPALIGLLDLSCLRVREQALEALANITYVERESRYHCLERGLLKKLNKLACRQPSLQCMQNIAKILANFTVNNHPLAISEFVKEVTPQIIPVLRTLIHHYDTDVLYKTCIALYYLAGYGYFDIIIENGFIQKVVNLFSHSSVKVSKTVYYVFIEMVKFINSDRIEYLIDNGILEYMKEPLMESDEKIQEITVSLFSKITASTLCNIQAVIDAGFIPLFIQLLNHDNPETRAEIIYIIFNIVNGGSEANIQYLLNFDIIGLLCKFKEDGTYHETVGALHTLFIILTRIGCRKQLTCQKMNDCGGTDKIRELQTHGQDKIQYFSSLIISQFFTSPFLKDEDVEIL